MLWVQLPDGAVMNAVDVFRAAISGADLEHAVGKMDRITGLPGMAAAIGALNRNGVLVALDEFQVCYRGPLQDLPSLLQQQVDILEGSERGGLIVLGSVQTEMEALLADRRAPLFGRRTFSIDLGHWDLATVFEVCSDHGASDASRCLTLWTLFGGVPKYWRLFSALDQIAAIQSWRDWSADVCESLFLKPGSLLRDEGEALLGRELHNRNWAILRAVAKMKSCTRAEVRQALPHLADIDRCLASLVRDLRLVSRNVPVFARERSGKARYSVSDQFLGAWLSAVEVACKAAHFDSSRRAFAQCLLPRLQTLEGFVFERLVREATEEASRAGSDDFPLTDFVRGYWNRPRDTNLLIEIDVVACNEERRRVRFGSYKRQAQKHDAASLADFRSHVNRFLETPEGHAFRGWKHEYALFSPRFPDDLRQRLVGDGWTCRDLGDFRAMLESPGRGPNGSL